MTDHHDSDQPIQGPIATTSPTIKSISRYPLSQFRDSKSAIALPTPAREVPRPPHAPHHGAVPMSQTHPAPPPPPLPTPPSRTSSKEKRQPLMRPQEPPPPPLLQPLYKQRSWSPDIFRDEAWTRRKGNSKNRRSKSVTDEDLDELKACIELGFGFDSPEVDQRLSDTLPALGLFYAVNKQYNDTVCKSTSSLSTASDCEIPSPIGSPPSIFGPDDNPQTMKTRLRQWAQVVACSVRQSS